MNGDAGASDRSGGRRGLAAGASGAGTDVMARRGACGGAAGGAGRERAGVDRRLDRHSGPHQGSKRRVLVEDDLHRDALHDFGEVAGRVVGRQERKGASGSRRPAVHMAGEREIGKGVDGDAGRLAKPDVGHLGLLVVRDHPDVRQRNDGDHLRADIDELAEPHLPLTHQPIRGRQDSRVAQVVRGERDLRLGGVDLRLELLFLDVDRRQRGLLLVELGVVQPPLRERPLGVVVGLFDQLLRAGDPGPERSRWRLSSSW